MTSIASKKRLQIASELGAGGNANAPGTTLDRLKQKLEERTLKNYECVLEDVRKQLTQYVPEGAATNLHNNKVVIQQNLMLKKLSVMKPPLASQSPSPQKHNHHRHRQNEGDYRASIDEVALLKKEDPFLYHGNAIYRFEDLIKFVEFDVSRGKVPRERVTEAQFDLQLEREIDKVRTQNKRSMGDPFVSRRELGGNPHLDNLLLLTSIDEFLNEREAQRLK